MRQPSHFLLLVLTLSVPAAGGAQISGYGGARPRPLPRSVISVSVPPGSDIGGQLRRIDDRIDAARRNGDISRSTARKLRREARLIDDTRRRFGSDGLSPSEHRELENRTLYLGDAVAAAAAAKRR